MSITPQPSVTALPRRQRGHTAPKAPIISLDQPGRLRVANILAILGISHATLYAGLKPKPGQTTTRYPKPDGRDGKFPYWKTSTIRAFLDA
jgi:predicted DNA-binding transcriptional regulator AlpA